MVKRGYQPIHYNCLQKCSFRAYDEYDLSVKRFAMGVGKCNWWSIKSHVVNRVVSYVFSVVHILT